MDSLTQTSLEALLLKATSSQNQNIDAAAVEAFCTLINKEKDGAHYGVKAIANRLHAGVEKEVLQTLNVLDLCMNRCGTHFQSEVGKFRFLNEMIKLVSPKYLGSHTPLPVRQKVLQLMYLWTLDYPKETKIKEAYDMLRKQGVIREIPNPNISMEANISKRKQNRSIFQDEEKSKVLQKLLQSKDPEDIQAANWLIKSMVKEDDKRAEMNSERISLLESVQNNIKLFNEMLDFYKPDSASADELDIIKELYQSCQKMRPSIMKLATETPQNEEVLGNVLQVSDDLTQVFNKYNRIIIEGKVSELNSKAPQQSLLDLDSDSFPVSGGASNIRDLKELENSKSDMDVLTDIFTTNIPVSTEVLQPTAVLQCDKEENDKDKKSKMKVLEELDVLSEQLLKENLQSVNKRSFTKNNEKIPMNLLPKQSDLKSSQKQLVSATNESLNLDLNFLINKPEEEPKINNNNNNNNNNTSSLTNGDDCLVDIGDETLLEPNEEQANRNPVQSESKTETEDTASISDCNQMKPVVENRDKPEIKLNDLFVKLDSIKPSGVPPLTILDEKNGVSITLHYAKDKPKENVHVYVITTVSKNALPLSNYLFQAVVPRGCKLKLQPPSTTDLPAYNPFLPPAAITQIMLIGNPDNVQISLKFIVSYVMDDETITEMGEVENLPIV